MKTGWLVAALAVLSVTGCGSKESWEKALARFREGPHSKAGEKAAMRKTVPRFQDYPVSKRYTGSPMPVNLLSHPQALRFRKRLIEGARSGPNFAGHYTVITWSCGVRCWQVAIVDARTGDVFLPDISPYLTVRFRLDSSLLIVDPPDAIARADSIDGKRIRYRSIYYVWKYNVLNPVFIQR